MACKSGESRERDEGLGILRGVVGQGEDLLACSHAWVRSRGPAGKSATVDTRGAAADGSSLAVCAHFCDCDGLWSSSVVFLIGVICGRQKLIINSINRDSYRGFARRTSQDSLDFHIFVLN